MQAVLVLLGQVLARIAEALGVLSIIQGFVQKTAQEHIAFGIETTVTSTSLNVAHPTYGLSAIHADIASLQAAIPGMIAAALDGLEVQATIPDQPSWYTAPTTPPTTNDIASAVWGTMFYFRDVSSSAFNGHLASTVMAWLGEHASWDGAFNGYRLPSKPYYRVVVDNPDSAYGFVGGWDQARSLETYLPDLDLSTVEAGDTVYSWLTREYSDIDWTLDSTNGETGTRVWYLPDGTNGQKAVYVDLRDEQLASGTVVLPPTPGSAAIVPPVWPGASGVTLGTTVALTSQLYLVDDMDGVIVAITTPPTRTGLYNVGGAPLDYGQGRIAFETDSGDLEPWQYLGFRSAIYTPKSMAHASAVRFQTLAGAAGTVTPWTVSA